MEFVLVRVGCCYFSTNHDIVTYNEQANPNLATPSRPLGHIFTSIQL